VQADALNTLRRLVAYPWCVLVKVTCTHVFVHRLVHMRTHQLLHALTSMPLASQARNAFRTSAQDDGDAPKTLAKEMIAFEAVTNLIDRKFDLDVRIVEEYSGSAQV
jgi:hypothetical protein